MSRATHDALGWARDAIQARIIARLFAGKVHDHLAVKGGMAFRLAHERWARATKDIDLDASQQMPLSALQGLMRRAIREATSDGLLTNVQITEPKQTETTARWKISGTYPRTGQQLHLTVEVSRRDAIDPGDLRQIAGRSPDEKGTAPEWVSVYTDQALAFKKFKAFTAENREAPRDLCDLYLLIQARVSPPIPQLRAWLQAGGSASAQQIWQKVERMDKAMFKAEVLPSLPPTPEGQALYEDWDVIRLTVGQHLEHWLKLASQPEEPCPLSAAIAARRQLIGEELPAEEEGERERPARGAGA